MNPNFNFAQTETGVFRYQILFLHPINSSYWLRLHLFCSLTCRKCPAWRLAASAPRGIDRSDPTIISISLVWWIQGCNGKPTCRREAWLFKVLSAIYPLPSIALCVEFHGVSFCTALHIWCQFAPTLYFIHMPPHSIACGTSQYANNQKMNFASPSFRSLLILFPK